MPNTIFESGMVVGNGTPQGIGLTSHSKDLRLKNVGTNPLSVSFKAVDPTSAEDYDNCLVLAAGEAVLLRDFQTEYLLFNGSATAKLYYASIRPRTSEDDVQDEIVPEDPPALHP